jgi:hypothetical protein
MSAIVTSGCTRQTEPVLFAITPTTTPPGYTNPYEAPVGEGDWGELLPSEVKEKCRDPTVQIGPLRAVASVSALTKTSTEFEDGPFSTQIDPIAISTPSAAALPESQATRSIPPASGVPIDNGNLAPTAATYQPPLQILPPSQTPSSQTRSPPSQTLPTSWDPLSQEYPQSQTLPLSSAPPAFQPQTKPSASPPDIIIDTQVLIPGSSTITVSSDPIFIGFASAPAPSSASKLGSSIVLSVVEPQTPAPTSSSLTTPTALIVAGTQILTPGAPAIAVSGMPGSLTSIPTAIVIGTNIGPVSQASQPTTTTVAPGPLVIGSQTLTAGGSAVITLSVDQTISFAYSSTALVVGTYTILPGAPGVTISNVEYSLAPSGTAVVVDGETVGSAVPSGAGTASGLSPAVFTGLASRSLSTPTNRQHLMALFWLGGLLLTTLCTASNEVWVI